MHNKSKVLSILIVIIVILTLSSSLKAIGGNDKAIIESNIPVDLWVSINGEEYLVPMGRNIVVPLDSQVCLLNTTVYASYDTRLTFSYWIINGTKYSNSSCINVEEPVVYSAYFVKEYMVLIKSNPLFFTTSLWMREGGKVRYTVPLEVNKTSVLYKFAYWDLAEDPLNNTVTIAVTRPLTITAYYDVYYPVRVFLNNSSILIGWFRRGSIYYYSAKYSMVANNGTRFVLEKVVALGSTTTAVSQDVYLLKIDNPTTIYPVYRREYLVNISLPTGNISVWVKEGEAYSLKAPDTIQVNDSVKLMFSHWDGDISANSPAYVVKVTRPLNIRAVYTEAFRVEIVSPLGTETRWIEKNGELVVYQPPELPGVLTSRTLDSFIVNGVRLKPNITGVLILDNVRRPLGIIVVYKTQILWLNIAVFFGFIIIVISGYIIYTLIKSSGVKLLSRKSKKNQITT